MALWSRIFGWFGRASRQVNRELNLGESPDLVRAVAGRLTYKDLARCCANNRLWRREGEIEIEMRNKGSHWTVGLVYNEEKALRMVDVSSPGRITSQLVHMDFAKDGIKAVACSDYKGKLLVQFRDGTLVLGDPFKNEWKIIPVDAPYYNLGACISPSNLLLVLSNKEWLLADLNNVPAKELQYTHFRSFLTPLSQLRDEYFDITESSIVWAAGAFYVSLVYREVPSDEYIGTRLVRYDTSKMEWEEVYVEVPPYASRDGYCIRMWPVSHHGKLLLYLNDPINQLMEAVFDPDGNRCTLLPCDWYDMSNLSNFDIDYLVERVYGRDDTIFFLGMSQDFWERGTMGEYDYILVCFRKDLDAWFRVPLFDRQDPDYIVDIRYFHYMM